MALANEPVNDSRPRRLSKPRTNRSYTNLLRLAEQQHDPSLCPSSSDSHEVKDHLIAIPSNVGESRGRRDTRSKLRSYLPGSGREKSRTYSSDEEDEGQRGFTEIARGMRNRLSRVGTGSSISQLPSAGASMTQLSCSSISCADVDPEESVRIAKEIKEKALMDSIAAHNHVSSPVDEDLHVDSVQSPIRRKSLYTPGIATRTPDDILRKPPPPELLQSQIDREYYFDQDKPETSPLARLAALEIGEGGRSTPNLDYSHLGGLKLGTLRVTNGTTSPVPQTIVPSLAQASLPKNIERENFAAPEDNESKDVACSSYSYLQHDKTFANSESSISRLEQPTSRTDEAKEGEDGSARICGSPLKYVYELEEESDQGKTSRKAYSKWLGRKQSLPAGFSFESPDQASMLAYDYMQDLPDSPFSSAELQSCVGLKTRPVSASDRADERSFDDEGIVISHSSQSEVEMWRSIIDDREDQFSVGGTREDAFQRLNSNSKPRSQPLPRPVSSSTASINTKSRNLRVEPIATTAANKADSGYSSNGSLNSLEFEATKSSHKERSLVENAQTSQTRLSRRISGPRKMPLPSLRPTKLVIPNESSPNPAIVLDPDASTDLNLTPEKSPEKSSDPSSRSLSKLRKLRKARRSSQASPADSITIQCVRNISQSHIPPVPLDIAVKHNERILKFPLLQHTYPSLQHVNSNDSLSREANDYMAVEFPSPTSSPKRTTSISNPSREPTKRERSRSRSRGKSVTRSQRSSQGETSAIIADFGTVLQSLGNSPYDIARSTVNPWNLNTTQSLYTQQADTVISRGRSLIGMDQQITADVDEHYNRERSQSGSRPIITFEGSNSGNSNISSRPQSIFADVRSSPAISESKQIDHRRQSFSRTSSSPQESFDSRKANKKSIRTRPKSMFVETPPVLTFPNQEQNKTKIQNFSHPFEPRRKSFDDRGGVPGKLLQTRSIFADAPPVPLLPTKEQLERREAQIQRSNSTKSITLAAPVQPKRLPQESNPDEGKTENLKNPPEVQDSWEFHCKAWSQRRKSVGDALRLRPQAIEPQSAFTLAQSMAKASESGSPVLLSTTSSPAQEPTYDESKKRPTLRKQPQSYSHLPSGTTSTTLETLQSSREVVAAQSAKFEHLADRYAGGLSYGYEPGYGLGGSAGTRGTKTSASRKSVVVSLGYGLDLSDVPVFVTPS